MSTLTTGRAIAFERLLSEDAIMLPQYRKLGGRGIVLAKTLNRPFSFERSDTAYSKTLDFLPSNWKGAAVESIGGKTLCWSQLVQDGNFPNDTKWVTPTSGGTVSVSSGIVTVSIEDYTMVSVQQAQGYRTSFVEGHKYLFRAWIGSSVGRAAFVPTGQTTDGQKVFTDLTETRTEKAWIWDCGVSKSAFVQIRFSSSTAEDITGTVENYTCFDLTQMFGAGNEPTAEQFESMFPASYYAYNAGELISAGVTGAVSESKNMCDVFTRSLGTMDNGGNNTLPRTFDYTKYYKGTTRNNYFSGSATKCDLNADNSINYTTATGYYGIGIPFKVLPGEQVTCSMQATLVSGSHSVSLGVAYYDANGYLLSYADATRTGSGAISKTVTIPDNARTMFVVLAPTTAAEEWNFSNIQLERGSTATAYTPYRAPATLPIPSAVRNLPGYGWSAGSVCNEVDWTNKKYIQRVMQATLTGTNNTVFSNLSLVTQGSLKYLSFRANDYPHLAEGNNKTYNSLSSQFEQVKFDFFGYGSLAKTAYAVQGNWNIGFALYIDGYTTLEQYTFYLNSTPLEISWELATPIETDISSLLSDDNLIAVEPGGTVTFENALGDGYRIPVPTKIKYQRRGDNS